jgi:glycosyltransferase involved in cell wall biosynthesis
MVSAYTPVKNEANYIRLYIENLKDKVDEIFLLDTGSTDGTLDIIETERTKYPDLIKLEQYDTGGQSYIWEEGKVRNYALSKLKNNWVACLDCDEMFSDNFKEIDLSIPKAYGFPWITFWKNVSTVRVNAVNDERWYPSTVIKLFPKDQSFYQPIGNHAPLWFDHKILELLTDKYCYHYHYALFDRCKANDNRLGDLGKLDYWGKNIQPNVVDEDFDWLLNNPCEYTLKTMIWYGNYPQALINAGLGASQSPTIL